jgi:hypothetical protein
LAVVITSVTVKGVAIIAGFIAAGGGGRIHETITTGFGRAILSATVTSDDVPIVALFV